MNSKRVIVFLLLTISTCSWGKPVLNIQNWTTDKGARVLFTEAHELPMVDIKVIFDAGSSRDGKQFGLAQFTNSMLGEGTKTLTADQIAEKFDQIGTNYGFGTDSDFAEIFLRCLVEPKILDSALQAVTSVLTEPTFPKREFDRKQKQILTTIKQHEQDPSSVARDKFDETIYGDFPYGHSTIGTSKTITALKPGDLQKFYQTHYNPKNALVVIVGDVTLKQAKEIADKITAKLPSGEAAASLPEITQKPQAKTVHIEFPSTQSNVYIGQIGITRDDPDYFPLEVGNYTLGQAPMISEFFKEVRDKRGLVYGIGSRFNALQKPGPFSIYLASSNEKSQEAIAVTLETLKRFVQNGITEEQLTAAKNSLVNQFPLWFATNSSMAYNLKELGIYRLPLNYFDTYVDKIKAVTLEQVRAAFKRRVDLNNLTIVTVGKAQQTAPTVRPKNSQ
ncbi:MAG: hypothetical protein ACD_21C00310G0002 [uncultured bacterium]|nr:MAG: hypothetical protein ACD_21C00310G0002 [uncultured bacterium]